jgi:hypothetical protein
MVSAVQFCTTESPHFFEFEVESCRTCRLRSKKAILEVATINLQKLQGFAKSMRPCVPKVGSRYNKGWQLVDKLYLLPTFGNLRQT